MLALADLTGRFLAHGVWCVSDPETFIPLIGHEAGGKRQLLRLGGGDLAECVENGKKWLLVNPEKAERAVLVFDAYLTLADGIRRDALFVRAIEYQGPEVCFEAALPYRPGGTSAGFAVYTPKILGHAGITEAELGEFLKAFWAGVKSHGQAAQLWADSLDESV